MRVCCFHVLYTRQAVGWTDTIMDRPVPYNDSFARELMSNRSSLKVTADLPCTVSGIPQQPIQFDLPSTHHRSGGMTWKWNWTRLTPVLHLGPTTRVVTRLSFHRIQSWTHRPQATPHLVSKAVATRRTYGGHPANQVDDRIFYLDHRYRIGSVRHRIPSIPTRGRNQYRDHARQRPGRAGSRPIACRGASLLRRQMIFDHWHEAGNQRGK